MLEQMRGCMFGECFVLEFDKLIIMTNTQSRPTSALIHISNIDCSHSASINSQYKDNELSHQACACIPLVQCNSCVKRFVAQTLILHVCPYVLRSVSGQKKYLTQGYGTLVDLTQSIIKAIK